MRTKPRRHGRVFIEPRLSNWQGMPSADLNLLFVTFLVVVTLARSFVFIGYLFCFLKFVLPLTEVLQEIRPDITRKISKL